MATFVINVSMVLLYYNSNMEPNIYFAMRAVCVVTGLFAYLLLYE